MLHIYRHIRLSVLLLVFLGAICIRAQRPATSDVLLTEEKIKNLKTSFEDMTDYDSIQNLVVAERIYRVNHRSKELAECYAPDAQIHTSWQSGGRDSFVGQHPVEVQNSLPIVNRCNPPLILINGDRAVVEYPMTTTREVLVHGEEAVLTSYMTLVYQVEKLNGRWLIVEMTSINEYDTLAPAIPGTDLKINPEDVKGLRESYRWLAYTRRLAGGTISQDLEGTDRPETVKRVYDAAYTWLNQNNNDNKFQW